MPAFLSNPNLHWATARQDVMGFFDYLSSIKPLFYYQKGGSKPLNKPSFFSYLIDFQLVNLVRQKILFLSVDNYP
jgi:hypothetical protein